MILKTELQSRAEELVIELLKYDKDTQIQFVPKQFNKQQKNGNQVTNTVMSNGRQIIVILVEPDTEELYMDWVTTLNKAIASVIELNEEKTKAITHENFFISLSARHMFGKLI